MIDKIIDNKYRVLRLIGSGGMANVYLAENIFTWKRYAIKVLKAEYAENREFLRRFELEARAVLKLSDKNIVRAFDVGELNGLPYIIMEYVDGKTLKDLLNAHGAMRQKTACDLFIQVLSALDSAHHAGFIHRDVKPQNVIVTSDLRAKLTDFGIARDAEASTVTFAGSTVLGSAHYISPEQAKGLPVTISSDIYSAGVMLYEMLTGTVPFTADSTVSVALKHINENPIPPIELNPDIYPSVNAVVLRAMSKRPEERFRSARHMLTALKKALSNPDAVFPIGSNEDTAEIEIVKDSPFIPHAPHWSWRIATVVLLVIIAFIGTFFGIRYFLLPETHGYEEVLTPSLIGKTLSEAEQRAALYHCGVTVKEYLPSTESAYGIVIGQEPLPGSEIPLSSEVLVIISSGSDSPSVPILTGKTIEEARAALQAEGLDLGHVTYQISDTEIGFICGQEPSAGTELKRGTAVDIVISSTSIHAEIMPDLRTMSLVQALSSLNERGFSRIFLLYDGDSAQETIAEQSPAPGTSVVTDAKVTLMVGGAFDGSYSCDVAFNLDIENSGTDILITLLQSVGGYTVERTVYHNTFEKGNKQPISFSVRSNESGIAEIVLYENGIEYKRADLDFVSGGEHHE